MNSLQQKDTRDLFDCTKCLCQLIVIYIRYFTRYSLLIVHLFRSLFDYLLISFSSVLVIIVVQKKRTILILNRVQVFQTCAAESTDVVLV